MDITIVAKGKLTPLWRLVKQYGTQAALARKMGVHQHELSSWLNLKTYPYELRDNYKPNSKRGTRGVGDLEAMLAQVTELTASEIWPIELRDAIDAGRLAKPVERELEITPDMLAGGQGLQYIEADPGHLEEMDLRKIVIDAISVLDDRRQAVLIWHFGLDGKGGRTLTEIAEMLGFTRAYIHHTLLDAIHKIQFQVPWHVRQQLIEYLEK